MPTPDSHQHLAPVVRPSRPTEPVLQGQKALVTGANSGIGRGIALALGQAGADVVVNYVSNPATAEEVAAMICEGGSQAAAYQGDVSQENQVQAMFQRMFQEFGV